MYSLQTSEAFEKSCIITELLTNISFSTKSGKYKNIILEYQFWGRDEQRRTNSSHTRGQ